MGETTNISWCDHTFNPWIGCTKVGPACDGCYAEALMSTEGRMKRVTWGKPGQRATHARTVASTWATPRHWDREARDAGVTRFVFCASLADVFDNDVPTEWRRDLFDLIRATPHLTWLLLTKRPQNIVRLFDLTSGVKDGDDPSGRSAWWPRNAAIGCTVVIQAEADRDIPHLLRAKAALKPAFAFLSMEPLLGGVELRHLFRHCPEHDFDSGFCHGPCASAQRLDWVITGGETDQSKHKARPSHPDWFRSLRDQCAAAGVAFHHKQNGEWAVASFANGHFDQDMSRNNAFWVDQHGRRHKPSSTGLDNPIGMFRAGKKAAGRLLDGVEYNARPQVSA